MLNTLVDSDNGTDRPLDPDAKPASTTFRRPARHRAESLPSRSSQSERQRAGHLGRPGVCQGPAGWKRDGGNRDRSREQVVLGSKPTGNTESRQAAAQCERCRGSVVHEFTYSSAQLCTAVSLLPTFTNVENRSQDVKRPGHSHTTSKRWGWLSLLGGSGVEGPLSTPGDSEPPAVQAEPELWAILTLTPYQA